MTLALIGLDPVPDSPIGRPQTGTFESARSDPRPMPDSR